MVQAAELERARVNSPRELGKASGKRPDRVTRTGNDHEVSSIQELWIILPGRDFCERVSPDDEEQLLRGVSIRMQPPKGGRRVRR